MLRPVSLIVLTYLLAVFSLNANTGGKWISMNLSNEDGLSNSAITCIYQDSEGLIWFGSWDGLNRYDGINIRVFKPDYFDEGSLSNNVIRNLLEDKHKNLWVVTDEGINRFLSNTMTFASYFSDNEMMRVEEQNLKACIGPDSILYVSQIRFGLSYYDEITDDFKSLTLPDLSDANNKKIIGLSGGNRSTLFLLSQEGKIFAYTKNVWFEKLFEEDLNIDHDLNFEKHWFIRSKRNTYLVIAINGGGLEVLNLETRKKVRIREHDDLFNVTTVNRVLNSDQFWVGTDGGSVYKLSLKTTPELLPMDVNMPDLSSEKVKIWTISQTSDDLLWIGTDGNGVYRYITKGKPFFNIKKGDSELGLLGHNIVRSVFKDQEGNLWVGTRGDGLNMLPHGDRPRVSYNVNNGLSNNAVLSLNMDAQNNLWIGVDGEGVDMLERSTGKFFHFPEDFVNGGNQEFGYIYSICIDAYGSIWFGTSGFGVVNMDVSRNSSGRYVLDKFRQFRYDPSGDGLCSDIVYSIVEERPNVLWLGTRGGGLHRLNTLNNSFEVFGVAEDHKTGLINDDVLSLCVCDKQKLWVGTSGGLSVLNLSYKPYQFQHYSERNGMPNNTVHGIMHDATGDVWISTNSGLARLNTSEGDFINFNKTDGLQNLEYTDGAVFRDTVTHFLYFGGTEGLDWFDPLKIEASDNFPPIFLNEFHLKNILVMPGESNSILSTSLNATDQIELRYNQNFFSFYFTTLNYYNSEKCQFAYYLEGFDNAWNYVGHQRLASFTNVPPGEYTLKVRATNEDLIYGNQIREVSILIHPPFWNTIVAFLFYLLILGLSIALILRLLKRRSIKRREVEMEKMERVKAEEINRYKLQFFTNIAHEFRTPLTLIIAPAAILEEQLDGKKRLGQYARSIFQNANRLQRLISELIEFRKVETKNMKLSVGRYELVQYISKLTKAFEVYAKLNNLSLRFLPSNQDIEAWIDLEKFEKILFNLVSNAFKFTPAGGKVEIELVEKDEHILLLVRDTGIGIPTEFPDKIFDRFYQHKSNFQRDDKSQESSGVGLSLTKSLVELHKGTITARNLPGGGSEFRVLIPNRREDFEQELVDDLQKPSNEKIRMKVEEEFQVVQMFSTNEEIIKPEDDKREYSLLVIDDSYEVCNLVESLLIDKYVIYKAYDGKTALETLNRESIDLVISDVIMPGMDGLELTSLIKTDINTSHIPVILLTARASMEHRIEGLEVGADSYIPKPFNPRHLMVRIEKLIASSERFRNSFREYDTPQPRSELLEGLTPVDQTLLTGLIDFIEENIQDNNLSADQLSSHIAMSKTQLYRKIKALTGLTPHGLINYLRLKKAAMELKHSEKTVSEVFYETGFNNRSYFYRSFKKAFGVPPGDYGKNQR